ncbi:MAG: hypothetical protein AAGU21_11930 [Solidesulfovibrio sp.]
MDAFGIDKVTLKNHLLKLMQMDEKFYKIEGMRRAWLRGDENVEKRYLIHVTGFNLGLLMRARFGVGTPREAAARGYWCILMRINGIVAIILVVVCEDRIMDHELAA